MTRVRHLNRPANRPALRHTTRMLGGARRPPEPNYLALACRALSEVIRIDKSLLPFMKEQSELLAQSLRDREMEAALRKVYGDAAVDSLPHQSRWFSSAPRSESSLRKQELALAKSRLVLAQLQAKLKNR